MANAFTSTTVMTNLIQNAYDKYVEFNLRSEPMFRKFADKRPVDVTNPGNKVVFQLYRDLSAATSTLSEAVDPDAVAISNTDRVEVTLNEYGNAVLTTEKLALESLSSIDPAVADMIAFNLRDSLDSLVYAKLRGLATGRFSGSAAADETTVNGEDISGLSASVLAAANVRKATARLRAASAEPRDGGFYVALIHPDVSYDLRSEAATNGSNVWQQPHTYTEAGVGNLWNGEIGIYEGVKFIESPRVALTGSTTALHKHYAIILGKQALLEAVTSEPKTVVGPVTDKLMRFRPVGWKGLLGWQIYRKEARYVITCKSSITTVA
jgi:N4-gp56 family major capsid protein